MDNPLDEEDALLHVLLNHEGMFSLWPAELSVPTGWSIVLERCEREERIRYVNAQWTDMRTAQLVRAAEKTSSLALAEEAR